ncbi:TPA: DUF2635 domain-containing protein [Citrobacter freundii]|nr:DUF2635 domain-containing protein [Citrobacter freundii]
MTMKQIKPARAGLNVRRPDGEWLDPQGETLPLTAYWLRRETEGDVVITDVPKKTNAPKNNRSNKLCQ